MAISLYRTRLQEIMVVEFTVQVQDRGWLEKGLKVAVQITKWWHYDCFINSKRNGEEFYFPERAPIEREVEKTYRESKFYSDEAPRWEEKLREHCSNRIQYNSSVSSESTGFQKASVVRTLRHLDWMDLMNTNTIHSSFSQARLVPGNGH